MRKNISVPSGYVEMSEQSFNYYDFFCGGGMAALGLGARWNCLMANDISEKKAAAYRANFPPARELIVKDVAELTVGDLPGEPVLTWASFPCQDLSLAGYMKGLNGKRSGTFWPFWGLMRSLEREGRRPPLVLLENVAGAVTSHGGRDFEEIMTALADTGYRGGALIINACRFVPQSRPRLFIVGVDGDLPVPADIAQDSPSKWWHSKALLRTHAKLAASVQDNWIWWRLPLPRRTVKPLGELIEDEPRGVRWHTAEETDRLLGMMSRTNLAKVRRAQSCGFRVVGTAYRRTRRDDNGKKAQRAEVRFDDISGCLRTPVGGSSRQIVIVVEGERIRSRLLSPREAARLMGVRDSYRLPRNYNESYHLMGDGLVVPAISWIERKLLRPLAEASKAVAEGV